LAVKKSGSIDENGLTGDDKRKTTGVIDVWVYWPMSYMIWCCDGRVSRQGAKAQSIFI
jgi:hypothetical protein